MVDSLFQTPSLLHYPLLPDLTYHTFHEPLFYVTDRIAFGDYLGYLFVGMIRIYVWVL